MRSQNYGRLSFSNAKLSCVSLTGPFYDTNLTVVILSKESKKGREEEGREEAASPLGGDLASGDSSLPPFDGK